MERGPGGHTPYGDWGMGSVPYLESRVEEGPHRYASDYKHGVSQDADYFLSRPEDIADRGLLDSTLIIYTSDHRELLGESGEVGHNPPIHANNVRVPMTFIHPSLENETITESVVRHVDLLPTIYSLLNIEADASIEPVGDDLTTIPLSEKGAAFVGTRMNSPLGEFEHSYQSVWDATGGYVFPTCPTWLRGLTALRRLFKGPTAPIRRRRALQYIRYLTMGTRCYDAPEFSESDAQGHLESLQSHPASRETTTRQEVDEDQLRQLGYLE